MPGALPATHGAAEQRFCDLAVGKVGLIRRRRRKSAAPASRLCYNSWWYHFCEYSSEGRTGVPKAWRFGDVEMAGDRGVSFPIAALSVVALFLSTTFLGQRAYDLMRLGEGDADKRLQQSQPPVEARLWEDPFSALNRYRAKLKELCAGDVGPNGVRRTIPAARG